jgi:hypothetical protein
LFVPDGLTEEEVLLAIENAVRRHSRRFTFGYYGRDDIEQEARIMAMEVLPKYVREVEGPDGRVRQRALEPFLSTHIHNRLCNLKRNKFRRIDAPCKSCHAGVPCKGAGENYCERYSSWKARNDRKASYMEPWSIMEDDDRPGPSPVEEIAEREELSSFVGFRVPASLRADYLRMRDGVRIPPARRGAVEGALREILSEYLGGPGGPEDEEKGSHE